MENFKYLLIILEKYGSPRLRARTTTLTYVYVFFEKFWEISTPKFLVKLVENTEVYLRKSYRNTRMRKIKKFFSEMRRYLRKF